MKIVSVTQKEFDRLWQSCKPQHRHFVEEIPAPAIVLGDILFIVDSVEAIPFWLAAEIVSDGDWLQKGEDNLVRTH